MVLIDDKEKDVVPYVDEKIVLQKISHLGVSKRLFRKHCMENGKCKREGKKVWKYDKGYILELSEQWATVSALCKTLDRSKNRLYKDIQKNKWTIMKLGRITLISKKDLFQ